MEYTYKKVDFSEFLKKHKLDKKKARFTSDFTSFIQSDIAAYESKYVACLAFDGDTSRIIAYGSPEKEEFDCIFKYLGENNHIKGSAIDAGAHYGIHSLSFSKHFERVFSFEPNPVIFSILDFNITHNNSQKNIQLFNCALSSQKGHMELFDYKDGNTGGATLEMRHVKDPDTRYKYDCEVNMLDSIEDIANEDIGLLKIDTEGHEYDVLQGAKKMIAKHKPVILMEDWDSRNGKESKAITLLRSYGYNNFFIPSSTPQRGEANGRLARLIEKVKFLMILLLKGKEYGLQKCELSRLG